MLSRLVMNCIRQIMLEWNCCWMGAHVFSIRFVFCSQVRGLWKRMDAFMSESREQQEVVSSIVTGVINKHTLSATALDLRVPEMLLRECERELLKVMGS